MSDEVTRQAAEQMTQKEDTKTAHIVGQQLLGQVIQERDEWRKRAEALATALESAAQRMTVDRSHLIDERDAAQVDLEVMTKDRDNWQAVATKAEQKVLTMSVNCSEAQNERRWALADFDTLFSKHKAMTDEKNVEVATLTAERNQARIDVINWQQRAETLEQAAQRLTVDNCRLVDERDEANSELAAQLEAKRVTIAQRDAAKENCRNLHAENEGLRADMLANPPEIAQQQLAFERKRALELQDDYNLKVTMNETLMDALKQMEVTLESSRHECHQLKIQLSNTMAARDFGVQVQAEALERALPREVVGLLMSIESSVNMARKMLEQKSR